MHPPTFPWGSVRGKWRWPSRKSDVVRTPGDRRGVGVAITRPRAFLDPLIDSEACCLPTRRLSGLVDRRSVDSFGDRLPDFFSHLEPIGYRYLDLSSGLLRGLGDAPPTRLGKKLADVAVPHRSALFTEPVSLARMKKLPNLVFVGTPVSGRVRLNHLSNSAPRKDSMAANDAEKSQAERFDQHGDVGRAKPDRIGRRLQKKPSLCRHLPRPSFYPVFGSSSPSWPHAGHLTCPLRPASTI